MPYGTIIGGRARQRRTSPPEADRGLIPRPLGRLRWFPIDTPAASGGVVNSYAHETPLKGRNLQSGPSTLEELDLRAGPEGMKKKEIARFEGKSGKGFEESGLVERVPGSPQLATEVIVGLLREGRSVRFKARGRSMYPTIRDGEIITINPIAPSLLKAGDIILYDSGGSLIAHRIARINQGDGNKVEFIVRSDTTGDCDETVALRQILGKVVCVRRQGRDIPLDTLRVKSRLVGHTIASRLKRMIGS